MLYHDNLYSSDLERVSSSEYDLKLETADLITWYKPYCDLSTMLEGSDLIDKSVEIFCWHAEVGNRGVTLTHAQSLKLVTNVLNIENDFTLTFNKPITPNKKTPLPRKYYYNGQKGESGSRGEAGENGAKFELEAHSLILFSINVIIID